MLPVIRGAQTVANDTILSYYILPTCLHVVKLLFGDWLAISSNLLFK